jgi:hypothetical protein
MSLPLYTDIKQIWVKRGHEAIFAASQQNVDILQ